MKFLFPCLLLFLNLDGFAQREYDVLHYKFNIELNDNNDTIYGKAEIKIRFLSPVSPVKFDLVLNKPGNKNGMIIDKVEGAGIAGIQKNANEFGILLARKPGVNDTAIFTVLYHGIPADGLIISKNQFGKRTFFADNWPNRAHNWIPCVDDPADKASVEFIVTAPSHYQVIANGIQVEETNLPGNKKLTHYKEDVPLPTKVMVIGAADFAVNNIGDTNCIPVSSWVYAENRDNGFYDYGIGKEILGFFIDYIGPYPYKKLANVQSKTRFGGMENAGAIFYNETTVNGQRTEERLFAHEIVHQWFGNSATEKSFAHLWLSEGFATYLTHVFLESKYGADTVMHRMRDEREEVLEFVKRSKRPVVDSTTDLMSLLNENSYQKGSWVLHMLRRELGDSVFHQSLREYYSAFAGKNAETIDLQKIFEKNSGKDLTQFFKQWLFTPENPSLDITWRYDAKTSEVHLHVKQLQNALFQFPLLIVMTSEDGTVTRETIRIEKREVDFKIFIPHALSRKPKHLVADPFVSLLFEARIKELR